MHFPRSASFWIYLLVCYVLLRTCFLASPWRDGKAITFDPAGYYLALPAHFIYDDLATCSFYDTIAIQYKISDAVSHTTLLPNGNRVMKYSLGMALLYSPGFLVGHQVAGSQEEYPADGYSSPYYFYLFMWSLLWAFLGLFALRKVLLHYFKEWTVAATLLVLVLTTNYIVYAGVNNLMSHSFLFTLYAFLLFFSWRWHERPSWGTAIGIGLVLGLLALARPTDIIAALIPLFWGVSHLSKWKPQLEKFKNHAPQLLLAMVLVIAIGSIQLFYWKSVTGQWVYYSYQEQGFDFLRPKLWKGLFSFKKGWLIYTPVMVFAIIGFWQLFQKYRSVFWATLIFSVINFYIVFSWQIWMYGGSIGSRAMVQSYAIWCFPLAAFFQYVLYEKTLGWKIALATVILFLTDLNLLMTWNARAPTGRWHAEYMSRAYYFKVAGSTTTPKSDRKFLDIDTELPHSKIKSLDTLVLETFDHPQDTSIAGRTNKYTPRDQGYSMKINANNTEFGRVVPLPVVEDYDNAWLRASVDAFYIDMEWHEWRMAQLQMTFFRNGEEYAKKSIRLQWLSENWVWQKAHFEVPLSDIFKDPLPGDEVSIILHNGDGEKDIFLDNLILEWIILE